MRPLATLLVLVLASGGAAHAQRTVIPDSGYVLVDRGGFFDPADALPDAPALRRGVFAPHEASGDAVRPPARPTPPDAALEVVPLLAPVPALPVTAFSPRDLDAPEAALARAAWAYVEAQTVSETGLVRPVAAYPHATMWDVGSGLAAVMSAHGLGMIDEAEFDRRIGAMLATLRAMPLYNDELPNREVDVRDGGLVAIGGRKDGVGSGWSALDLGRLALWLDLLRTHHPRWDAEARAVIGRWRTERLVQNGEMWGTYRTSRGERFRQEGRTGYEEYAARGLVRWGIVPDVALALDHTAEVTVEGVSLRADMRDHAFLTADPFVYAALEMGTLGSEFDALAASIWEVHRARWRRTGEVGAFAEDALDTRPWFAYHNLVFEGAPFAATTGRGRPVADAPTFSAKAALAYAVLHPEAPLAARYREALDGLVTGAGVLAGRYADGRPNRSLNINTNAVALTALWVAARGGRPLAEGR